MDFTTKKGTKKAADKGLPSHRRWRSVSWCKDNGNFPIFSKLERTFPVESKITKFVYLCGMKTSQTIKLFQEVVELLNDAFPLYNGEAMQWWVSMYANNEAEVCGFRQTALKVELDNDHERLYFYEDDNYEEFITIIKNKIALWK